MKISVIGCGYLGAVHAAGMASLGHEVVGLDVDTDKIARLQADKVPFHEPGFDSLLTEQLASGRLEFTTDPSKVAEAEVHFIGVGTPQQKNSKAADLSYVHAATDSLIPYLREGTVVVGKSTVPVGTARALRSQIQEAQPSAELIWNPEFLREGFAIKDTLTPDRIVYGVADDAEWAAEKLDTVYRSIIDIPTPRLIVNMETAELVKVSANAFLATKISFINAMAEVCEATGGDVTELADAIGHDVRIGRRFLNSGLGFGGGCLPKDIRAFHARSLELGLDESLDFLRLMDEINLRRRDRVFAMAEELVGGEGALAGKTVAVWGLSFKPDSDDIRESPALDVAGRLVAAGATVRAYDPAAMQNAIRQVPGLVLTESPAEAAEGAEVVVLCTEWREFRELDPAEVITHCPGKRIVDGRNCLDRDAWVRAGWTLRSPGRPDLAATE